MAAGRIVVASRMPALDLNGTPISGALLRLYVNGTTELTSIYADEALTIPLTNPVAADSGGNWPDMWQDASELYSVALTDADGVPLSQPSAFDDFGLSAPEDASESAAAAIAARNGAEAARDEAEAARDEAREILDDVEDAATGALGNNPYPAARSYVPQGVTDHGAITGGSGGTDGTFAAVLSGGNFEIDPTVRITVASGALTEILIDAPGLYVGAAPSAPTIDFGGTSTGLSGAAGALTIGYRVASGAYYWTDHADDDDLWALFVNDGGVATEVSPEQNLLKRTDFARTGENDPNWTVVLRDDDDNIGIGIRSDGRGFVAGLDDQLAPAGLPTLLQVVVEGQSLGEGAESYPVLSTADTGFGNYRFSRGVRTWVLTDNSNTPTARAGFDLTALTAAESSTLGETIANGMADGLKARLTNPFGLRDVSAMAPHVLVTAAIRGGLLLTGMSKEDTGNTYVGTSTTSIAIGTGSKTVTTQTGLTFNVGEFIVLASPTSWTPFMAGTVDSYNSGTGELTFTVPSAGFTSGAGTHASWRICRDYTSYPGAYYPTMLDDVLRASEEATARGWSHGVVAVFMQGERNAALKIYEYDPAVSLASVCMASYTTKLMEHADDLTADIGAITDQTIVPLFIYQTISSIIGQAQLDAANQHSDIFMVGPHYHMPRATDAPRGTGLSQVWGAAVHLHADGERWFGEMVGKVVDRVMRGENWQPLQPLSAVKVDASTFDVTFHVPRGPLVIDTDFFGKIRGFGFEVYPGTVDAPGTRVDPDSMEIVGSDTVRFTTPTPLPAGAKLWAGAVGQHDIGSFTVASVGVGADTADGWPTHTVTITGDHTAAFAPVINHGPFTLTASGGKTAIIRSVGLDGGNTVLTGEDREKTGTFAPADALTITALASSINLRDSDNAMALNSFSDIGRSTLTGRYPLQNWCVAFAALEIEGA